MSFEGLTWIQYDSEAWRSGSVEITVVEYTYYWFDISSGVHLKDVAIGYLQSTVPICG